MKKINLPPKQYYTIGEVAQAFNLEPSKLRFWEKEFEILNPQRSSKGIRKYTPADVEKFRLVYYLVEEELYTLQGAKKRIKERSLQKELSHFQIIEKLEAIKQFLLDIKEEL